MTATSSNRSQ